MTLKVWCNGRLFPMKSPSDWMGLCLLGCFTACATMKAVAEQTQLSLSMPTAIRHSPTAQHLKS